MNTSRTSLSFATRLSIVAGVAGLAYILYRTFTVRLSEEKIETNIDAIKKKPLAVEREKDSEGIQSAEDGEGPYYHRLYSIGIEDAQVSAEALIERIRQDMNACSPLLIARFEKTKSVGSTQSDASSKTDGFAVGDEFQIHITGPWNGPVRVVESKPDSFTLATKDGHMEAGGIQFRARPVGSANPGSSSESTHTLIFEVESWSRSRDGLVDLVYDKIPAARLAQTQMWSKFCQGAATLSGGKSRGDVQITTEKAKM